MLPGLIDLFFACVIRYYQMSQRANLVCLVLYIGTQNNRKAGGRPPGSMLTTLQTPTPMTVIVAVDVVVLGRVDALRLAVAVDKLVRSDIGLASEHNENKCYQRGTVSMKILQNIQLQLECWSRASARYAWPGPSP